MAELDVRSLILDTTDADNIEDTSARKKSSSKPTITFKVVLNNYPDVAIERKGKTEKSKKLLVLLLSQKQYYVKGAAGKIDMITNDDAGVKVLAGFFHPASMPDGAYMPEEDIEWLGGPFLPGVKHARYFIKNYLYNNIVLDLIKHHKLMIPYSEADIRSNAWSVDYWTARNGSIRFVEDPDLFHNGFVNYYNVYDKKAFDIVYQYSCIYEGEENTKTVVSQLACANDHLFASEEVDWKSLKSVVIFKHLPSVVCLIGLLSYEGACKYVDAWFSLPQMVDFPSIHAFTEIGYGYDMRCQTPYPFEPTMKYETDKFIDFTIFSAMREGYADSIDDFFNTWADTLRMEKHFKQLGIRRSYEKYPKHLDVTHNILSYQSRVWTRVHKKEEQERLAAAFEERMSELEKNEYSGSKYIIRVPRSVSDILDEATQQANCLASYSDAVANGTTDIYFMRLKAAPDRSVATIEVRNGAIRQALGHSNHKPTAEQVEFINKWAVRCGFVPLDARNNIPLAV